MPGSVDIPSACGPETRVPKGRRQRVGRSLSGDWGGGGSGLCLAFPIQLADTIDMTEQEIFLTALDRFEDVGQGVELASELLQSGAEMRTQVKRFRVLIPLVGAFNAGKTSLVNAHLQRQAGRGLPTDIVPQTALATEIYSVPSVAAECIELLGEDDTVLRSIDLEEFGRVEKQALKTGELQAHYAKAYLHDADQPDSNRKVLVDMPGLDSGLRTHNAAIQRYLPRGGYFIMVVDADHGTLRHSEIGSLREFLAQDMEFTVLINKIDKKMTDAEAIVSHIEGQVRKAFGKPAPVRTVSAHEGDVAAFYDTLAAIDFDRALRGFWRPKVVGLVDEAIQSLHTRYSALNLSAAESDRVIAELERKEKALQDKLRQDERDIKSRYSSRSVERIVGTIREAISNRASNLAEIYFSLGKDALDRELNELVRQTLNRTVGEERSDTLQRIVQHYQADINEINAEYDRFTSTTRLELPPNAPGVLIDAAKKSAEEFKQARDNTHKDTSTYTAIAGVLAATTAVVAPWLEAVLILLPSVLRFLSEKRAERERQEQIERQRKELPMRIRSSVAPKIASELRSKVEADYANVTQEMLAELRQRVETAVGGIRADINKSQTELESRKQDIQDQRNQLRAALEKLTAIKKQLD